MCILVAKRILNSTNLDENLLSLHPGTAEKPTRPDLLIVL